MLKKSLSAGLFSSNSNRNSNKLLIYSIKDNKLDSNSKIKQPKINNHHIIKLHHLKKSNIKFHKFYTNIYGNHNILNGSKVYLKLDKSEEIAKIILEEEKKRYFNREFHLNKIVNREELKRRIESITPYKNKSFQKKIKKFEKIKYGLERRHKRPFTTINNNGIKSIKSLININNKLIHNYKFQGEKEIIKSKMNYEAVTNFLKSMDEKNQKHFEEMEKKFLEKKNKKEFMPDEDNKKNKKEQHINNNISDMRYNQEKNKRKINKNNEMKLKESNFIKFKKRMIIKEKKLFQEKSKVFDNILHNDFKNYYTSKDEDDKYQTVNYRLLSRTILMRNLMKQMKITVYKDECLNVLRGFQSLKIASLNDGDFKNKDKDGYYNQNNNDLFVISGSIKDRPIPHFLKLKFNMNTAKKFGEINGSYFGLPV